jgi:ribose transport system substrate-binding protein
MRGFRIVAAGVALCIAAASPVSSQSPLPSASAPPSGEASGSGKTLTFISALLADANWAGGNECWLARAEELGYTANIVAPQNETASNADMVALTEQAIAEGPDGIEVVPLVPAAFDDVLGRARDASIPVVALVFDATSPDLRTALVATDNAVYGQTGAELLVEATGGTGKVGILWAGPDVQNQLVAKDAFNEYLAANAPDLEVVAEAIHIVGGNRSPEAMAEVARGMLVANPEITAIYTPDGGGAVAAVDAVKELGKQPGEITIIGSDYLPKVADGIRTGYMHASVAYPFCEWGRAAVDALDQAINGTLTESEILLPPTIYNAENNP